VTDQLGTAKDVAAMLGVPESWVREHTRSGAIPHVELGRYKRYDLDEVRLWVASLKGGGGPRFRRYDPINSPRSAGTLGGATPRR
jgi:hypothetical protein